jgi:hypothetical protein
LRHNIAFLSNSRTGFHDAIRRPFDSAMVCKSGSSQLLLLKLEHVAAFGRFTGGVAVTFNLRRGR